LRNSIRQRGKKYEIIVDIGIDPNTGKRRLKTKSGFNSKREAELFLRKWLNDLDDINY